MKPILALDQVSKRFRIQRHQPYLSLRDKIMDIWKPLPGSEDFWALSEVSFSVNPGDSLGIIGRNGAGKSTLLKILSKITPPTRGTITGRGRMASLLEVGTGFHPELTGRENIFFNGSLMGMKNREIESRFEEIVEFSGTEIFLDTPLKHYSSGMQLRLAFSVAAFLEPEILIIDEVLAVGDAEFQKKCMGKMEDVRKSGRTILFVSHNMAAVSGLCNTALLLEKGRLVAQGKPDEVIHSYLSRRKQSTSGTVNLALSDQVTLREFQVSPREMSPGSPLNYDFVISSRNTNPISGLSLLVYNELNERIGIVDFRSEQLFELSKRKQEIRCSGTLNNLNLVEGMYHVGLFISSNGCQGDFYDLDSFHMALPQQDILPYDRQHRGYIAFHHTGEII